MLLLWIGIKLIAEEDGGEHEIKASDRLFAAVQTVIIADLVMSLDNVLGVAAAAKGSLLLLVFGLVVSIPLVVARQPAHHEADRAFLPEREELGAHEPGHRHPAQPADHRHDQHEHADLGPRIFFSESRNR